MDFEPRPRDKLIKLRDKIKCETGLYQWIDVFDSQYPGNPTLIDSVRLLAIYVIDGYKIGNITDKRWSWQKTM